MAESSWYGYTVEVDEAAARDHYARAGEWSCTCGHCRSFLALARARRLPREILAILDRLRIPPEKATYVCERYHDADWREKGLLYEVQWRVAGTVIQQPEGEENGCLDWGPAVELPGCRLMLGHETFPVEPKFPTPHFDLDVSLYLPWALDEPVDGPEEE